MSARHVAIVGAGLAGLSVGCYARASVCNDDTSLAPPGHSVVQAMLPTDYEWWASRGSHYQAAKDETLTIALYQAYEGWMPNADGTFGHVPKTLPGLEAFLMAAQGVEPGGGVPTAILSGRQAAQILRAREGRSFVSSPAKARS